MKVSRARLERAEQLRDAALRILARAGHEVVISDEERGFCPRTIQVKVNGLTILRSWHEREQLLDVWQFRKVFSIAWTGTRTYLVTFRPGTWENILLGADAELTWASVRCSFELKRWLTAVGTLDNE
jgi:hypothetical protein